MAFQRKSPAQRYLGDPCKHGHNGVRYVSNNCCVECLAEYGKTPRARAKAKIKRGNLAPDEIAALNAKAVEWQVQNKTQYLSGARYRRIRGKYGISPQQYDALVVQQNGLCAVCLQACPINDRLSIDHCHKTKAIRGLLCAKCNIGLGWFRDSPILLESAAAYLRVHDTPLVV